MVFEKIIKRLLGMIKKSTEDNEKLYIVCYIPYMVVLLFTIKKVGQ